MKMPIKIKKSAATRDRTRDLQIFSLTLSQLSYHGLVKEGKENFIEMTNLKIPENL